MSHVGLLESGVCIGHDLEHLLCQSVAELSWPWSSVEQGWLSPGFPQLRLLAAPWQHFRGPAWYPWRFIVTGDLGQRSGFRGFGFVDFRASMVGVFGMVFSLCLLEEKSCHVALVEKLMGMVIPTGMVSLSLLS